MSFYFRGENVSLAEAFPMIHLLDVEVITSAGITKFDEKDRRTYSLESPPPAHISCPRGGCTGSGFDVQGFLVGIVAKKETEFDKAEMCRGQEKMGRHQYRSCVGNFRLIGKIEYKSEEPKNA